VIVGPSAATWAATISKRSLSRIAPVKGRCQRRLDRRKSSVATRYAIIMRMGEDGLAEQGRGPGYGRAAPRARPSAQRGETPDNVLRRRPEPSAERSTRPEGGEQFFGDAEGGAGTRVASVPGPTMLRPK
jgi:hypothetical protein